MRQSTYMDLSFSSSIVLSAFDTPWLAGAKASSVDGRVRLKKSPKQIVGNLTVFQKRSAALRYRPIFASDAINQQVKMLGGKSLLDVCTLLVF